MARWLMCYSTYFTGRRLVLCCWSAEANWFFFSQYSSVSAMIDHLSWPSLELRRKVSRLQTLYNIINEHYSLAIPPRFILMGRSTRLYHPSRYVLPNSHTYSYQQSFYPQSIKDWNNLPSYLIESNNFDSFSWTTCIVFLPNYFCNDIAKLSV